ncbi:MAG: HAD family hydrolase, partial [Lachnospiraceae bacterium]|nr:HAD family hydrolase [Lachnospiraceae bacterium]
MKELEYPFDGDYILKKKKSIRRELLEDGTQRIRKNIAILGGSTTANVAQILDLFLLNNGIEASFYESEYNKYYEDALFGNPEFDAFDADVIYLHTGIHNIMTFPKMQDNEETVNAKLNAEFERFRAVWEKCFEKKGC